MNNPHRFPLSVHVYAFNVEQHKRALRTAEISENPARIRRARVALLAAEEMLTGAKADENHR